MNVNDKRSVLNKKKPHTSSKNLNKLYRLTLHGIL